MEQDVLRLEISVNDVVIVHVLNSCANLPDILLGCFLRNSTIFLQILIKIFAQARLQDQIS